MANLTKMRRENTQISKFRNAKGEITRNKMENQPRPAPPPSDLNPFSFSPEDHYRNFLQTPNP
jgi:hypothetical protein